VAHVEQSGEVLGLPVRWESSDPSVLSIAALQAPAGSSRIDSLQARRRVIVHALRTGAVALSASVDDGAALKSATFAESIRVVQKWVSVSAGDAHTCGLTVDSTAYCWGAGAAGALGYGRLTDQAIPVRVVTSGELKTRWIAGFDSGGCVISGGDVGFCWGSGFRGRLGNNDATELGHLIPVEVAGGIGFESIVGGSRVSCAVGLGSLYCWGDDSSLQLGVVPAGLTPLDTCTGSTPCARRPRQVSGAVGSAPGAKFKAQSVDVGGVHTCALGFGDGLAYCWGASNVGALGAGTTTTTSLMPVPVSGGFAYTTITTGTEHTCALRTGGIAYCWGQGNRGQLGGSNYTLAFIPTQVAGSESFTGIAAGGQHTCAIATSGAAYCWGAGADGELGTGGTVSVNVPTRVQDTLSFQSISAGLLHTCAISKSGSMYCWGFGPAAGSVAGTRSRPTRISEPM
jgi:hypothetical protein